MSTVESDSAAAYPSPVEDWIGQGKLAEILGISPQTASARAAEGLLLRFQHGVEPCGRRKYSRTLVQQHIHRQWEKALERNEDSTDSAAG